MPSEINQSAGWQDQFLEQEPIVQMSLYLVFHSAGLAEVSEVLARLPHSTNTDHSPCFPGAHVCL